jgi:hypothetical protein
VFSVTDGVSSTSPGPSDFASTFAFTNDPITIGTTALALHLTELRSTVNALRSAANLGAYSFADTMASGLTIKALHLTQLRDAVNDARSAFSTGAITFSQSPPAVGGLIRASHINDLRGGVQ